jgi:WD40 repeat protein
MKFFNIKYYILLVVIICILPLQNIFSQIIDSTIQKKIATSELSDDTDIILNKNITNEQGLKNSDYILNILPKRGIIVSDCEGIKIWKLANGAKDTIIKIGGEEVIKDILISRDESKLVVSVDCYNDREDYISCYSLTNFKLLWRISQVNFENGLGLFGADSLLVAVGSWDVTTIDLSSGKIREERRSFMKKYLLPNAGGVEVQFSRSGRYILYWNDPKLRIFSLGIGSRLRVWDLAENRKVISKFFYGFRVWSARFLPDERNIITGNNKGLLKLWSFQGNLISKAIDANVSRNQNGRKEKNEVDKIIMPVQSENFIGIRGKYNNEWALKIYNYPEMKLKKVLINPDFIDIIWPANFSDDGKYLALSDKGFLSLYNTENWKCLWRVPIKNIAQKNRIYYNTPQ